ncbi:MAG: tetratricopeptide repeat protein [Pseudomonadota bacterium]
MGIWGKTTHAVAGDLTIVGEAKSESYGHTPAQPIPLGGFATGEFSDRLAAYFELVRNVDFAKLMYVREGACCPREAAPAAGEGTTDRLIEVYLIRAEENRFFRLYFDGVEEAPLFAPKGLAFARNDAELKTLGKAIGNLVGGNELKALDQLSALRTDGSGPALHYSATARALSGGAESEVFALNLLAAKAGFTRAQYLVALAYHSGRGVPRDKAAALDWLNRAAARGDDEARTDLAHALLDRGNAGDAERALELAHYAARRGQPDAQLLFGQLLVAQGTEESIARARLWLGLAKQAGIEDAATLLSRLPEGPTSSPTVKTVTPDTLVEFLSSVGPPLLMTVTNAPGPAKIGRLAKREVRILEDIANEGDLAAMRALAAHYGSLAPETPKAAERYLLWTERLRSRGDVYGSIYLALAHCREIRTKLFAPLKAEGRRILATLPVRTERDKTRLSLLTKQCGEAD